MYGASVFVETTSMAARGLLWSCIALLVATCTLSHVQADEDVAVCGGFVKLAPPLLGYVQPVCPRVVHWFALQLVFRRHAQGPML